jgi:hypothetical protein
MAWYLRRAYGDGNGYEIYEDDTPMDLPTSSLHGWNYWQTHHSYRHHRHPSGCSGGSTTGGGGPSESSGGGAAGGEGGSW